jgi:hypothetical protein
MSIMDLCGNCPVWGLDDGEFFLAGMRIEEKIPPKKIWG